MNGKGGHGQNDERVAEPPTGSINGNFMKHKWILIENNGNTMTFLNNIVEMKMAVPPESAPEWPVRPGKR